MKMTIMILTLLSVQLKFAEASKMKVKGELSIKSYNADLLETTSFADKKIDYTGGYSSIYFSTLKLVISDDESKTVVPVSQEDFTLDNDGGMYLKSLKIGSIDVAAAKAKLKSSYEAYRKEDPRGIRNLIPTIKMDVDLDSSVELNFQFKISQSDCFWKGGFESTGNQRIVITALISDTSGQVIATAPISNKAVTCKTAGTLSAGGINTLIAIFYVIPGSVVVDTVSGGSYTLKDVQEYVEYASHNPTGLAHDIKNKAHSLTYEGYVENHYPSSQKNK